MSLAAAVHFFSFLHCSTSLFRLIFYSYLFQHSQTLVDTGHNEVDCVWEDWKYLKLHRTQQTRCLFFYRFRRRLVRFLFAFLYSAVFFSASLPPPDQYYSLKEYMKYFWCWLLPFLRHTKIPSTSLVAATHSSTFCCQLLWWYMKIHKRWHEIQKFFASFCPFQIPRIIHTRTSSSWRRMEKITEISAQQFKRRKKNVKIQFQDWRIEIW